jgi:iron complex outermembrane receptor protein
MRASKPNDQAKRSAQGNKMISNMNRATKALLLTSVVPLAFVSTNTYAQDSDEYAGRLDEIVVTARKRTESLQEVPVAVSALSAGQLERGAVQTVLDIAKHIPNVELHAVTHSGAALGASIRGVGFDDLEKTFEPTVGVSVDGVFMASNSGAVVDFFDIESVEVLRGPQGTLFGRNTIAGVINIKRTAPTGEWGGKVEGTYASHDRVDLKGLVNIPLGENGGLKLNYRNLQQDSHLFNVTNNERPKNRDSETASAALRYDFTDKTTATLTYDWYDHNTQPADEIAVGTSDNFFCGVLAIGCDAGAGAISRAGDNRISVASEQILSTIAGDGITLNVDHEEEKFSLKYIFGVMNFEELAQFNSWGAPTPLFEVRRDQEYEQTSHEVQFISDFDGMFNFVAGVYILDTESFITSGPVANFTTTQDASARAVFGEATFDVSENWTISAGARYTAESKELDLTTFSTTAGRAASDPTTILFNLTPEYEDDNVSFRVSAQRKFDWGMIYSSYSTGYRSGGFNNRGTDLETVGPYDSEKVENIELGIRSRPTDNLQLNLTGFITDYTNKQQFVVTSGTECGLAPTATCTFVRNAAETSNNGVEFEGVWTPTDALTMRGSLAYLDAKFDEYIFDTRDISDNAKVIYAPKTTGSLTVEHNSNVFGGDLTLSATGSHRGKQFGNAPFETYDFATGPDITIEAHTQLDLSATFITEIGSGQEIKFILYGTDVFDRSGRVSRAFDAGAFAWQELVPGREVGVTVGYSF